MLLTEYPVELMGDQFLAGLRILVIEDEYFLAEELKSLLLDAGAARVRLSGELSDALSEARKNAYSLALLDLTLQGEKAFAVADKLRNAGLPFGFVTGYDRANLPARFARVPYWGKPISRSRFVQDVRRTWFGLPSP